MSSPQSPSGDPAAADVYSERLYVPAWWWLAGALLTGIVGYEISLAAHGASWSVVGYFVVAILIAWLLWSMGRVHIRVTADGELVADKATLPRAVIDRAASVPPTAKSAALGRQLDPAAYLMHRAWVKTMVLLVLDDPDDPTPYWLVSTRHPEQVLAALNVIDARHAPAPTDRD
ncbi:DUF3093 domain-containing protein [Gordonia asplenii]|uniref:DUF3093 domain-containing protein n=1 Tax=Gordonia asplenii TaxID=2725283 RepID=UPI0028A80A32|nr:DUF3093 domain-containing protein [Gordonia asplenii]